MRGASISARASASICCSPPLIEPASWLRRSARRGKASKQKSRLVLICARAFGRKAPSSRFSSTVNFGKQPASFRHQRDAEIDDLLGGAGRPDRVSRRRSRRRCCRRPAARMPMMHFISVLLPLPLVPSSDDGLAAVDGQRHVLEHPHRAVGGVHVFDGDAIGQDMPSPLRGRASRLPACRRRSSCRRPARPAAARSSSPRS